MGKWEVYYKFCFFFLFDSTLFTTVVTSLIYGDISMAVHSIGRFGKFEFIKVFR